MFFSFTIFHCSFLCFIHNFSASHLFIIFVRQRKQQKVNKKKQISFDEKRYTFIKFVSKIYLFDFWRVIRILGNCIVQRMGLMAINHITRENLLPRETVYKRTGGGCCVCATHKLYYSSCNLKKIFKHLHHGRKNFTICFRIFMEITMRNKKHTSIHFYVFEHYV